MKLIEWEVKEDNYQEQIIIPEAQRKLAADQGISTENRQKVAARIQNLNTGEIYTARLAITGTHHPSGPPGMDPGENLRQSRAQPEPCF